MSVLAAIAGSTQASLVVIGLLVLLVLLLSWRLSSLKRQYAWERASAEATYLRALVLLRMRYAPGEWHSLHGLVQELAIGGDVLQQILYGLAQEGYVIGPHSDKPGDVYYQLTPQAIEGQLR